MNKEREKTTTSTTITPLLIASAILGLVGAYGAYCIYDEMQYNDEHIGFICNNDDMC